MKVAPCLWQKEQSQARGVNSSGRIFEANRKVICPQWQLPRITGISRKLAILRHRDKVTVDAFFVEQRWMVLATVHGLHDLI
jgi:hypothetical protein